MRSDAYLPLARTLRRSLRTGGWERLARGLPQRVLVEGVPLDLWQGRRRFRIALTADGAALACLLVPDLAIAVADRCLVPIDSPLLLVAPTAPRRLVSLALPAPLADRLATATARTGRTKADMLRRALSHYLAAIGV